MNLKALQTLVAIYESNSFQEAARRLNISQSAVSMHIKALEDSLGTTLFDRKARPPAISELARSIIPEARDILERVEAIHRLAHNWEKPKAELRLGSIPTATLSLVPDALADIRRLSPNLHVFVETGLSGFLLQQIESNELAAAIITSPAKIPDTLVSRLIYRERMALVAAAGSPEPKLEDLTSLPFIRFDRTIGVGRIIDLLLERRNINPRETMELDSVEAILAMVERGLGFAIVPERCVNALQRYRLKLVPIDAPDAERDVVLIWHKDQADKTQMEMLLAALTRAQNRPFQGIA